jgi:hypothetical protein
MHHSTVHNGLRGMAPASRGSPQRIRQETRDDNMMSGLVHAALSRHSLPQQSLKPGISEMSTISRQVPRRHLPTPAHHLSQPPRRHPSGWSRSFEWNVAASLSVDDEYTRQWYASKLHESSMGSGPVSRESHRSSHHVPRPAPTPAPSPVPRIRTRNPSPRLVTVEAKPRQELCPVSSRVKRGFEEEFTGQLHDHDDSKVISISTRDHSKRTKVDDHSPIITASMLEMLCSTTLELGPIQDNPTGCSCPRSNCIKLYCDCFKAGRRCTGLCSCAQCKNTEAETRTDGERIQAIKNTLARNPRAFTGGKKEATPRNPGDIVCNCVKSKCLKLYCDCFRSGQFCDDGCACNSCLNTKEESGIGGRRHLAIQQCLEKKPDAFTKKIKDAGSGCACKNNRCLKKYCECFRMELVCSANCTCRGCENAGNNRLLSLP